MQKKLFAVPFSQDKRMAYAKDYLIKNGYEITDVGRADYVLLPIPVKPEHFAGLEGKTVFYGFGNYEGYDYNKNESFLLTNSYLTAEGAIALFKENSEKSLLGANVLISGYGRIGKALHRLLNAYGSSVTVCDRSNVNRTQAVHNNAKAITLIELSQDNNYDVIFNTVPQLIFSKSEIDAFSKDTMFIELASFPGGIDKLYAKSKGVNLIDGKQLPLRYSAEAAGALVAKTVLSMIEEGLG